MSVQALPQFTPAQVLDAGRRAEAEGRFEFAQQFYRHLVTYYANSLEAAEAHDGLARIGGHSAAPAAGPDQGDARKPDQTPARGAPQHPAGDFVGETMAVPMAPANPASVPRDAGHYEPAFGPAPGLVPYPNQQMRHPPQGPPIQPPLHARPPRMDQAPPLRQDGRTHAVEREVYGAVELPPPVHAYRTGRLMARLLTWFGGGMAFVGCAALPVSVLSPRSLRAIPLIDGWFTGLSFGAGVIAIGLAMMLFGQLTRALLEQANATVDLAAIARARAELEADLGRRRT